MAYSSLDDCGPGENEKFNDACREAVMVLRRQHPQLNRDIALGTPIPDPADRIYMDIGLNHETLRCFLKVELLLESDKEETHVQSYGTYYREILARAEIGQEHIARMLRKMSWENRRNIVANFANAEQTFGCMLEQHERFDDIPTMAENLHALFEWIMNPPEPSTRTA
ncbi:MAG TPA: hypothetical protein VHA78_01875 [Candidatus Peribacteraceae bacterium]|nr:hypothetical protein [Candidatus Peribacteraceae bacterium]